MFYSPTKGALAAGEATVDCFIKEVLKVGTPPNSMQVSSITNDRVGE